MEVISFTDFKPEIIKLFRECRLIPVLGSGFSVGSLSRNGKVPSGTGMKDYMIKVIEKQLGSSADLNGKLFSQISTYYNSIANRDEKRKYILDNFTKVELSDIKCKFLEIDWMYVYTLNIDDAVERSSRYNETIISNREVDFTILKDNFSVIKLHGDASMYLKYFDDKSQIFDFKQYADSITTNKSLLDRLTLDFTYNNLIFIGCSLDGEFDLASIGQYDKKDSTTKTLKIFCSVSKPDALKTIDLESYGITHIVIFNSYDDIYESLNKAYQESKLLPRENIDIYKNLTVRQLDVSYEENNSYLFHGKMLVNIKSKEIVLPNYFIKRSIYEKIVENIKLNTIHIIYGGRVTGKTYVLASLVQSIKDRDVYFFNSQTSITKSVVDNLFTKTRTVFIFDTNSTNKDMLFYILSQQDRINKNNNNVIITINTSDKEIISILNLNENKDICGYKIESRFSFEENQLINSKMPGNVLPNWDYSRTILDNIIEMEKKLEINGSYHRLKPLLHNKHEIAVLILLAVREKLYTVDLSRFNIYKECYEQITRTRPLIEDEHTLFFERDIDNPSEYKVVLNAKYWLYRQLGDFAHKQENYDTIVEAYKHIISIFISTRKNIINRPIEFIKFDVINEIFQTHYKGQAGLAKALYEGLHTLLADNPHYFHQRAKCLLWQSDTNKDYLAQLTEALRFAKVASYNLNIEYKKKGNDKILISLAHIQFTITLIMSKICVINNFIDIDYVNETVNNIHDALNSPFNLNEIFDHSDKMDLEKVIKYVMDKGNIFDYAKVSDIFQIYNARINKQ